MGHLLGYARVSTTDQQPHLQVDALTAAGCYRVFTETASGARADRPTLEQLLDQLRPGDTLVVWKLDRLGRSLRHLVDTITGLADRGVGFGSLQGAIDTTTRTPTATNLTVRPKPWNLACECALKGVRSPGESVGKGPLTSAFVVCCYRPGSICGPDAAQTPGAAPVAPGSGMIRSSMQGPVPQVSPGW
jgi:hypothetical protein